MSIPTNDGAPSERELTIKRTFDAPRAVVFGAWRDPQHLARWSGPRGFTTPHHTMDFRTGGTYRACLRGPDGTDHWVRGTYREILEPERLVFTHAWEDENGQPGRETVVTVTFDDLGGRTAMTFHQAVFDSVLSRDGHRGGWSSSFERLADHLATLRTDRENAA